MVRGVLFENRLPPVDHLLGPRHALLARLLRAPQARDQAQQGNSGQAKQAQEQAASNLDRAAQT